MCPQPEELLPGKSPKSDPRSSSTGPDPRVICTSTTMTMAPTTTVQWLTTWTREPRAVIPWLQSPCLGKRGPSDPIWKDPEEALHSVRPETRNSCKASEIAPATILLTLKPTLGKSLWASKSNPHNFISFSVDQHGSKQHNNSKKKTPTNILLLLKWADRYKYNNTQHYHNVHFLCIKYCNYNYYEKKQTLNECIWSWTQMRIIIICTRSL